MRPFIKIISLAFLLLSLHTSSAAINAGDIAVIGLNLDANNFAIVTLAEIPDAEVINLTDIRADGTAFMSPLSSDGILEWTVSGPVPAGTVIEFTITASGSPSATMDPNTYNGGLSVTSGWTSGPYAGNGDQVIIFQGNTTTPTFIYGFSNSGIVGSPDGDEDWLSGSSNRHSGLPSGLLNSDGANPATAHALHNSLHVDNAKYTGPTSGSKNDLLTAIGVNTNWGATNNTTPQSISPSDFPTFAVSGASVPALSDWALFIYAISFFILGIIGIINTQRVKKTQLVDVSGSSGFNISNIYIPFDKHNFHKSFKTALFIIPPGFALIYLIWGEIIVDDFIGMALSIPLVAYMIYLIRFESKAAKLE